jgi:hypothetical protein
MREEEIMEIRKPIVIDASPEVVFKACLKNKNLESTQMCIVNLVYTTTTTVIYNTSVRVTAFSSFDSTLPNH